MVFSAHRSTQMHHLLQLAAIVIALLMLFCLQLSFGRPAPSGVGPGTGPGGPHGGTPIAGPHKMG
ncbi:hypothetical protein SEVIR_3G324400v4 [Setaria viridis]|uniref:Uncharacterized protein n=1 Tax=Setaria viridis TaxID=4556 RepID=A0A4V6DA58_SETVI|nr:hypothetical protein SEVIR_3G324400v2 [Setaria viridis]